MRLSPGGARQRIALLAPATRTDGYGDPVDDWSAAPERTPLPHAWVQWVESDGLTTERADAGRVRVTARPVLFVPGRCPAALTPDARVEVDGATYRVDGAPHEHRNRTRIVYTAAALVRVTG